MMPNEENNKYTLLYNIYMMEEVRRHEIRTYDMTESTPDINDIKIKIIMSRKCPICVGNNLYGSYGTLFSTIDVSLDEVVEDEMHIDIFNGDTKMLRVRYEAVEGVHSLLKQVVILLLSYVFHIYFNRSQLSKLKKVYSLSELLYIGYLMLVDRKVSNKLRSKLDQETKSDDYIKVLYRILSRNNSNMSIFYRFLDDPIPFEIWMYEKDEEKNQSVFSTPHKNASRSESMDDQSLECYDIMGEKDNSRTGKSNENGFKTHHDYSLKQNGIRSGNESQKYEITEGNRKLVDGSSTNETSGFFSYNHISKLPKNVSKSTRRFSQFIRYSEPLTNVSSNNRDDMKSSFLNNYISPNHKVKSGLVQSCSFEIKGAQLIKNRLHTNSKGIPQHGGDNTDEEKELEDALVDSTDQQEDQTFEERIAEFLEEMKSLYLTGLDELFTRREFKKFGASANDRLMIKKRLLKGNELILDKITGIIFDSLSASLSQEELNSLIEPMAGNEDCEECDIIPFIHSTIRLLMNDRYMEMDNIMRIQFSVDSNDAEVVCNVADDIIYYGQNKDIKGLSQSLLDISREI